MADFITWVEVRNRPDPYLLIDTYVFNTYSERKDNFREYKNGNDILGGEAIIKHFKLNPAICKIKTVYNFWNTKKLHPKVAEMMKRFDHYWSWMFQNGYLKNAQLLSVIEEMSEKLEGWENFKNKVWVQLLSQGTDIWELSQFLEHNFLKDRNRNISDVWKEKIAEKVIELTKQKIKEVVSFYKDSRRDLSLQLPSVELWGLCVIQNIFDSTHKLNILAKETETKFKNNLVAMNRPKRG